MPKLKTHKGAKARIHVTGTGRLMRRKRMSSHLRRKKPTKVTRAYDGKLAVDPADVKRLGRLIPYR
jgi:large subunit ribosomal protein L35